MFLRFVLHFLLLFVSYFSFSAGFVENKGQVRNQFGEKRDDIYFVLHEGDKAIYLSNQGYSVQFFYNENDSVLIERVDFKFEQFDGVVVNKFNPIDYHENYCFNSNQIKCESFERIEIADSVIGMSLVFYVNEKGFKYDIVLSEKFQLNEVKVTVSGAQTRFLENSKIEFATKRNSIIDEIPESWMEENGLNYYFNAQYSLTNSGYRILLPSSNGRLTVIDPLVYFGTYFGGNQNDDVSAMSSDNDGNLIFAGTTMSAFNIATVGAPEQTLAGAVDIYMGKMNEDGELLFATYYDVNSSIVRSIHTDTDNNIYISGMAADEYNYASTGTHQQIFGGGFNDCFLLKFDPTGNFLWGTLFGGEGNDLTDNFFIQNNAVYLIGSTTSSNQIATPGAFQTVKNATGTFNTDAFIAKFDLSGNLLIATYYGGVLSDAFNDITGNNNFIYLAGSFSNNGFGTPGTYAPTKATNSKLFFAKFDANLLPVWGSYYTGNSFGEFNPRITYTPNDKLIIGYSVSSTTNTNSYTTPGSFQDTVAGEYDFLLIQFDTLGLNRDWATHFGGTSSEVIYDIATNEFGEIFVVGTTTSTNQIATENVHKTFFSYATSGATILKDAVVAKFNQNGVRIWASYYGGNGEETVTNLVVKHNHKLFFAGKTSSNSGIAFDSNHQAAIGGANDGYIVCFDTEFDTVYTDIDSILTADICPKELVAIPFEVHGFYESGTLYHLTISDETGSFSTPLAVQSKQGEMIDTFYFQIPYLVAGGNYKFKVVTESVGQFIASDSFLVNESPMTNFEYQVNGEDVYFNDISLGASNWEWSFGDGNDGVIQNPMHTYSALGEYNVMLVSDNGVCSDTAFHPVTIFYFLDDNKIEKDLVRIYNLEEQWLVQYEGNEFDYEIYAANGALIIESKHNLGQTEISKNQLTSGVYFLVVKDHASGQQITFKIYK